MKYFIPVFFASLILSSCNKKVEEPKLQSPDTVNNAATALKSEIDKLDKNAMKTHKGALNALINLPGGGPIPPHLLPIKETKLLKETDSTASYSISAVGGAKAKVAMKRRITGQDTVWIVTSTDEQP